MTHSSISIYDLIDKLGEHENQDAINISSDSDFDMFSMSDGAGGIGIYCKEWANFLVSHQPVKPIENQKEAVLWFNKASKEFYDQMLEGLPQDDDFVREKFYGEGSYATILFSWINKERNKLHFTGVGDTTLFHFVKDKSGYDISIIEPMKTQQTLYDNPDLLNWKLQLEYQLTSTSVDVGIDDCIIICSDSLSRRIIYQLLLLSPLKVIECLGQKIVQSVRKDFLEHLKLNQQWFTISEYVDYLRDIVKKDHDGFSAELHEWFERNELEKDDYSFIIIDL